MSDISPVGPGAPGMVPTPGAGAGISPAAARGITLNGHHNGLNSLEVELKAESPAAPRLPDVVQLSERALYLESLRSPQEVRQERVAAARQAIERGDYPNVDQLAIAIDRMMARMRD